MPNETLYCAIVADIKDSKKMTPAKRNTVQKKLIEKIRGYNQTYRPALAAKIDFSGGDQIQALFYDAADAYDFACALREDLFPITFRVGLGLGDWSVRVAGGGTNKQDGTSYHNARKAFEKAHDENRGLLFSSGYEVDAVVNVLAGNEDRLFNAQTAAQKQLSLLYRDAHPIGAKLGKDAQGIHTVQYATGFYKAVAERMQTTAQNVAQQIKRGKISEQRELKAAVLVLLRTSFPKEEA